MDPKKQMRSRHGVVGGFWRRMAGGGPEGLAGAGLERTQGRPFRDSGRRDKGRVADQKTRQVCSHSAGLCTYVWKRSQKTSAGKLRLSVIKKKNHHGKGLPRTKGCQSRWYKLYSYQERQMAEHLEQRKPVLHLSLSGLSGAGQESQGWSSVHHDSRWRRHQQRK